jgi:HD-like signal output (HDOD) protein
MREELLKRMREDVGLPVLPEILLRLDRELRNPDIDASSVANIISMDPVLAGQVLRMANSAYYSRGGGTVSNVSGALMRLGVRTIHGLVYALSLPKTFPRNAKGRSFSHSQFWKHSLAVAAFAKALSKHLKMSQSSQDLVYLAGLVHDVGALLMLSIVPQEYTDFLTELEAPKESEPLSREDADLSLREIRTFGIDHAELGSLFLEERWKMAPELVQVVREHHKPDWNRTDLLQEVMVIHVADGVCASAGASWESLSTQTLPFQDLVWDRLGISLQEVDVLLEQMQTSLEQAQALLSLSE